MKLNPDLIFTPEDMNRMQAQRDAKNGTHKTAKAAWESIINPDDPSKDSIFGKYVKRKTQEMNERLETFDEEMMQMEEEGRLKEGVTYVPGYDPAEYDEGPQTKINPDKVVDDLF